MASNIKIAVDAMGGDNSPKKIIDGILVNSKENKDVVYNIFGDKDKIELLFPKNFNREILPEGWRHVEHLLLQRPHTMAEMDFNHRQVYP